MTVNIQRGSLRFAQKRRPGLLLVLLLQAALLGRWPAQAQENRQPDYRIKAAFLYNFGKFVEWPDAAFASTNAPLVIGVLGGDPFHGDCERIVGNKNINGHPVIVRQISYPTSARQASGYPDLKNCHILFISASGSDNLPDILDALKGAKVLTVTDNLDHFATSGVIINFVMENQSVRFEINDEAARRAGLRISSKLLMLRTNQSQK
jgi:YfiR/HmsC-like